MDVAEYIPFWDSLTKEQQETLKNAASSAVITKGNQVFGETDGCLGFVIVESGCLRAFITSEQMREITLFRLQSSEFCLFSAGCIFGTQSFTIQLQALTDSRIIVIPAGVMKLITEQCIQAATFMNSLMAERFNNVMWLLDQVLFQRFDVRLLDYLKKECELQGTGELHSTHETIARDLGSAREVVSRMLGHFEEEGLVQLGRGIIRLQPAAAVQHNSSSSR